MGIEKFGLKYPVVMDNEYKIWTAFANRAWPAKYLIDGKGYFRYVHLGEGAYIETELAIQLLLREIDPEAAMPDPMKPAPITKMYSISLLLLASICGHFLSHIFKLWFLFSAGVQFIKRRTWLSVTSTIPH